MKRYLLLVIKIAPFMIAAIIGLPLLKHIFKEPTAADLLSQQYFMNSDSMYLDANLKMHVKTQFDMNDLLNSYTSAETTTAILLDTEFNVKSDSLVQYLDGIVNTSFYGYEINVPTTNYTFISDKNTVVCDYDFEADEWVTYKTVQKDSPYVNLTAFINQLNLNTIQNYELSNTDNNTNVYYVSGTIDTNTLMAILCDTDIFEDTFSGTENNVSKNSVSDVVILYDKKTRLPVTINIGSDNPDNITNVTLCLTINEIETKEYVTIPDEIINIVTRNEDLNSEY